MSYVHIYPFTVRHYECDAFGQVHDANMLRYMQEAAFAGSAAVGYSAKRYSEIGLHWLAYETDVAVHQPLRYGDDIRIRTWVVDFRRVRSLRNYEFYRGDDLVAQASTDWVLIDTQSLRPASIPDEMIAAYSAGDPVEPAPPRQPLPQMPRPQQTLSTNRVVQWAEIDPAMHVNNAFYLAYATDASAALLSQLGWSQTDFSARDMALVPERHQIEYKLAAVVGDELEIHVWFGNLDETGGIRYVTMTRMADNKLMTRIRTRWVWAQAGQVTKVASSFLESIHPYIV